MLEEEEVRSKRSSIVDILQAGVQYLTGSRSRSGSKRSSSEILPQSVPSTAAGSKRSSIVESLSTKKDEASPFIRSRSASGRESIEVPRSERRRSRLASATESEQESNRSSITRSKQERHPDLDVKRLSTATNISEDTIAQITDMEEDADLVSEQEEKTLSLKSDDRDNGKNNMPLCYDDPHCKLSHEISDKSSSLKSY